MTQHLIGPITTTDVVISLNFVSGDEAARRFRTKLLWNYGYCHGQERTQDTLLTMPSRTALRH